MTVKRKRVSKLQRLRGRKVFQRAVIAWKKGRTLLLTPQEKRVMRQHVNTMGEKTSRQYEAFLYEMDMS